jgi:hypothetical protein
MAFSCQPFWLRHHRSYATRRDGATHILPGAVADNANRRHGAMSAALIFIIKPTQASLKSALRDTDLSFPSPRPGPGLNRDPQ